MINTGKLAGRTLFITGASRGIGKAIALKAAKDGANVVIAAKTADPHPKLPGTIFSAAKEIEAAGGKCLPCVVDVRDESQVQAAVDSAIKQFGGIDILVNNASAISLTGTLDTAMKKYDLMHTINTRGTFLVSKCCLPYLKVGKNPHILNISPPLSLNPRWFKDHVAYTMAKYGMSMCVLGMAEEFKADGIAVNALWPRTAIITAAMEMLGGKDVSGYCRKPEIMSDAAYVILTKDSRSFTGQFTVDEKVLRDVGVTDFEQYAVDPKKELMPDFFLDEEYDNYLKFMKTVGLEGGAISESTTKTESTSSAAGAGKVSGVFEAVKSMLNPQLVDQMKAVYSFDLKGKESGKWFMDAKNAPGKAGSGDPETAADVTFAMDSDDFVKMFSGQLKPTAAFMTGKLKIKGDMGKAMKLEKLMGQMKAKL